MSPSTPRRLQGKPATKEWSRRPRSSTASRTGLPLTQFSATSAGSGAISSTTARRKPCAPDAARRPTERGVEQGRTSALPTRDIRSTVQPVGDGTRLGQRSARLRLERSQELRRLTSIGLEPSRLAASSSSGQPSPLASRRKRTMASRWLAVGREEQCAGGLQTWSEQPRTPSRPGSTSPQQRLFRPLCSARPPLSRFQR